MYISLASHMDGDALASLQHLSLAFPGFFRRALSGVGFNMKQRIVADMKRDQTAPGPPSWPPLSLLQQYQRLDHAEVERNIKDSNRGLKMQNYRLAEKSLLMRTNPKGRFSSIHGRTRGMTYTRGGRAFKEGQSIVDGISRWKGSPRRGPKAMSRLIGSIRYKITQDSMGVVIGALKRSAERYLIAVQEGAFLDDSGAVVGRGRLYITPRMRRHFWAAKMPISKNTRYIVNPERPLIRPLFERNKEQIVAYIKTAIEGYLQGFGNMRDAWGDDTGLRFTFGSRR